MSEKKSVTTFRVYAQDMEFPLEGPVLTPDKSFVAEHISHVHEIATRHHALLVYAKQWVYVPFHSVLRIERGQNRFTLPWPLRDE